MFQPIETAPLDHPVMVRANLERGPTMARARWNAGAACWVYATDDPDYISPLGFAPEEWRALDSGECDGICMSTPAAPHAPRA